MELTGFLNTPLDYYSIIEKLGEIEWKYSDSDHDEYYWDYEDLFTDLANGAAHLYEDMEALRWHLFHELPDRSSGDSGVFWFDTAALLIDETDFMLLMENEGMICPDDEDSARSKRIRALKSLTKDKTFELYRRVFNCLMRYLKLLQAYEMLCAMVDELRRLHSFRERNGAILPPPSAFV